MLTRAFLLAVLVARYRRRQHRRRRFRSSIRAHQPRSGPHPGVGSGNWNPHRFASSEESADLEPDAEQSSRPRQCR